MTHSPRAMRGMTLIELGVVLLILVALAGMTLPMVTGVISNSGCELTEATLQNVRSAIIGSPTSPGFVGDMNRMPYNLTELITCPTGTNPTFACGTPTNPSLTSSYNPSSQSGWRGPYLTNSNKTTTAPSITYLIRKILQLGEANMPNEAQWWQQRRVDATEASRDGSAG